MRLALALAAALSAAACSKPAPPAGPDAARADEIPPADLSCASDDDCAATADTPTDEGGCRSTCQFRAGNRAWVEAVAKACAVRRAKGPLRPEPRCTAPAAPKCEAGTCVLAEPVRPKVLVLPPPGPGNPL